MEYSSIKLQRALHISELYAVHYFEFSKDYACAEEQHDFWEMVYVDKGELVICLNGESFTAKDGELMFYAPGQTHAFRGNGYTAANVMVVDFCCKDKLMGYLADKRLQPSAGQRALLKDVLRESRQAFSSRLDNPWDHTLVRAKDGPIGCEQMIGCYMTELIVSLLRQMLNPFRTTRKTISTPLLDEMVAYMEQNLSRMLTLDTLAEEFHVSTSCVKRLFSQYKQTGAMQFFTLLKIERAKKLLREQTLNSFQIAEQLGYDNSHYFCNRFKKYTGMSPMEYRRSVNAINPEKSRSSGKK